MNGDPRPLGWPPEVPLKTANERTAEILRLAEGIEPPVLLALAARMVMDGSSYGAFIRDGVGMILPATDCETATAIADFLIRAAASGLALAHADHPDDGCELNRPGKALRAIGEALEPLDEVWEADVLPRHRERQRVHREREAAERDARLIADLESIPTLDSDPD